MSDIKSALDMDGNGEWTTKDITLLVVAIVAGGIVGAAIDHFVLGRKKES